MLKRIKTNPVLLGLIDELRELSRENDALIWRDLSKRLRRPTRNMAKVNLKSINRNTMPNDVVVVPGKVLGSGEIDHPITVAAFNFSEQARAKIMENGRAIKIIELVSENPGGKGVKILE
ncbi:MAG: 50S ribosomal protein L18e [Candidatus Syntrophoarchaeum sp. GoM_oil]|nr:MAG: 50S ribosomal protein L18e [Candidatus Syntrophoarchaeum sp. GoM_oil]